MNRTEPTYTKARKGEGYETGSTVQNILLALLLALVTLTLSSWHDC
ncbi:MAG: hypothetical protein JG773_1261 [Spirochaeta sp.]|jgi:hypothetical protein|nr:hypothetical protein [Spirochaeta sp.]